MPAASSSALRKEIRELVRRVPESDLYGVKRYLEYLAERDSQPDATPPVFPLSKPMDDEIVAMAVAEEAREKGDVVSHEEARRILLGDA